jgi:hypothetical protein
LRTSLVVAWTFLAGFGACAASGTEAQAAPQSASPLSAPPRIASPAGRAEVEVGGNFDVVKGRVGGHWIEMRYGRPLKRGRDLFGLPDWVEALNDGAPVWRAGANVTTRLATEIALTIGGTRIEAGEYSVFVELGATEWTLIVSSWPHQERYDSDNHEAVYGAYGYTPDQDVARTPMSLEKLSHSFEQLSWQVLDITESGGRIALVWDDRLAWVPFELARDP